MDGTCWLLSILHILCFCLAYGKLTLRSYLAWLPPIESHVDSVLFHENQLVVGKKGDPPPWGLGGWKTDGAPTSSVHLDLLLPVFKHHLAPCLSRKSVHCAYALTADCLVSIWQLRGSYGSYESWCHIALICAFRFLILMSSLSLFYFVMLEFASTL